MKTNKKVIGIALAVAIVAVAGGLGFYFLLGTPAPDGSVPGPLNAELTILSIEGLTVSVSAEGSTGHDGNYEWDFGETIGERITGGTYSDMKTVNTITTSHTYAAPGAYEIALIVREPETGEFFRYISETRQMVEVGGTGFAPSITIDLSTYLEFWKLLFTEVPTEPVLPETNAPGIQQDMVFLGLYDADGVKLLGTAIRAIRTSSLAGDEQYHPTGSFILNAGDYILLSVSVYPAGTTYKLIDYHSNWVMAEGTLDPSAVPDPFLVSVSKSQDGLTWELRFTSVPNVPERLASSILFAIGFATSPGDIFGPTLLTDMTNGTAFYAPLDSSPYIAVGDYISLSVEQFQAGLHWRLLDNDASRNDPFGRPGPITLVSGFLE